MHAPQIYIDKLRAMEMQFCFKKYSVGENEKQQNSLITFVFRKKIICNFRYKTFCIEELNVLLCQH